MERKQENREIEGIENLSFEYGWCSVITSNSNKHVLYFNELENCSEEILINIIELFNYYKKDSFLAIDSLLLHTPCMQEDRELILECIYNHINNKNE